MLTSRSVAIAIVLMGLAGGRTLAATCHLTVQGASILDDEDCTVSKARGSTKVFVAQYGTILVRGSAMSVQIAGPQSTSRRYRRRHVSLGQVLISDDSDEKSCYFGQKATLCVEQ